MIEIEDSHIVKIYDKDDNLEEYVNQTSDQKYFSLGSNLTIVSLTSHNFFAIPTSWASFDGLTIWLKQTDKQKKIIEH